MTAFEARASQVGQIGKGVPHAAPPYRLSWAKVGYGAFSPIRWSPELGQVSADKGHSRGRNRAAWGRRLAAILQAHSMIWSARATSPGGIVRPSALAVFRLTMNANLAA